MNTQTFGTASQTPFARPPVELSQQEAQFGSGPAFPIAVAASNSPARSAVLAVGVWMAASGFLGTQPFELILQSTVMGLCLCAAITWRVKQRAMRFLLIGAGSWLLTSSIFAPYATGWVFWNNELLAVVLLGLSFAKSLGYRVEPPSMLSSGWV